MPCGPCFGLFSGWRYVIFSSIWSSNPLCSICSRDVYRWLHGILVFVKALSWEKCCCCSANRMLKLPLFSMYPVKPMLLGSLETFSVSVLKFFVLYNFLKRWLSLSWVPDPDHPSVSWFGSWLQCPSCASGVKRNHQLCPWVRPGPCWFSRKAEWIILCSLWCHPSKGDSFQRTQLFPVSTRCLPEPNRSQRSSSTEEWPPYTLHRVWGSPLLTVYFGIATSHLWASFCSSLKCVVRGWTPWGCCGKYCEKKWHRLICALLERAAGHLHV